MAVNLFLISVITVIAGCVPQVEDLAPMQPGPTQTGTPATGADPAGNNTIGSTSAAPELSPAITPAASPAPSPTLLPTGTQMAGISTTFISDADAYVKQSEPGRNYGDEPSLKVDSGSDADESFVRFTVTTVPGDVQKAILRLYSGTNGSQDGPVIYTADGTWSEGQITWNNRPAHEEDALDNQKQIAPETWVEYDVTAAVTGSGSYTFVIAADSGDAVVFSSREGDRAPELMVTFVPGGLPAPTPTLASGDITFVGAGDISMCSNDYDELTARLLDDIPGTVFTTGDNAYPEGRVEDFMECYDPTWGRHKDRTYPIPGNHDYRTEGASGYYQYFENIPPYYAYDLGSWRIYAMNSEIDAGENSEQAQWAKLDLATHPNRCVLVYWHRPRWSSGSRHGNDTDMQALWEIFSDTGAELVLSGHEHNYERFMPMDAKGLPSPLGMRQFVVGTAGSEPYPFGPSVRTSEVRATDVVGVLKLTLRASSYDWEFIPAEGFTFTDSGSAECH